MLVGEVFGVVARPHQLDEPYGDGAFPDEVHEGVEAGLEGVSGQDAVDLHIRQAQRQRAIKAGDHGGQAIVSGDPVERRPVQGIDADIQVGEARVAPARDLAVQVPAVGGDADLGHAPDGGGPGDDLGQVAAHAGLSTGQPDLGNPQRSKGVDHALAFQRRQEGERRGFLETVRQAIGAAEVADLGDREPQIVEAPAEAVDEIVQTWLLSKRGRRRRFQRHPCRLPPARRAVLGADARQAGTLGAVFVRRESDR